MASDGAVPVEKEWQQIEEEPVVEIRYPGLRDLLCHVLKHCKACTNSHADTSADMTHQIANRFVFHSPSNFNTVIVHCY